MRCLHKFLHLSGRERVILIQTLVLLWIVRLGLWLLPFQRLRALVSWAAAKPRRLRHSPLDGVQTLAWAVRVGSRYVPSATCLTQALTGQVLLSRRGYAPKLRIGVAQEAGRGFEAHAWLLCDDEVVIGGGANLTRFTPMPSLDG